MEALHSWSLMSMYQTDSRLHRTGRPHSWCAAFGGLQWVELVCQGVSYITGVKNSNETPYNWSVVSL